MARPEGNGADEPRHGPEGQNGAPGEGDATAEIPLSDGAADEGELRRRLEARKRHLKELYDETSTLKLAADEARVRAEASGTRVRELEEERDRLRERVSEFEEEERRRRRRREGQDRRVARLGRELERRDAEIQRLETLMEERAGEIEAYGREAKDAASRKDVALEEALRRIEGLERDLEEREAAASDLRGTIDRLRAELDLEYELRRRMAEPANRIRAGIDLFNGSEHLRSVGSISKSLGSPEVHVVLEGPDADEPAVVLTFTWQGITWQAYAANPGLAVEEPRVYQRGAGEDLSGVDREPPNARVGPGGRVFLGL
ncbi:hypothetical protein GBA65_13390 [Rubrobacter marinus]|uniref:Uncharacterized protein n=1 Tax=Rubrobacter marinus TaxID=2653852 RepID=A0A6G8PYT3_9ACTN|nr:hypothetical protein [Rubrobacter marinus]QIN79340.1 hypothetical protein GBA65_13390 [Rubrobacter marinus]